MSLVMVCLVFAAAIAPFGAASSPRVRSVLNGSWLRTSVMYFGILSITMVVGLLVMIFGLGWVAQGGGILNVAFRSILLFASVFAMSSFIIFAMPMVGRDYKLMVKDVVHRKGLMRTIFFGDR